MRQLFFVVERRTGPEFEPGVPVESQSGWAAHAEFMDELAARGWVVLGGPLEDEERVVLVVDDDSEDAVRATLAADPWSGSKLQVSSVERWTIRLDGRPRPPCAGASPQS